MAITLTSDPGAVGLLHSHKVIPAVTTNTHSPPPWQTPQPISVKHLVWCTLSSRANGPFPVRRRNCLQWVIGRVAHLRLRIAPKTISGESASSCISSRTHMVLIILQYKRGSLSLPSERANHPSAWEDVQNVGKKGALSAAGSLLAGIAQKC